MVVEGGNSDSRQVRTGLREVAMADFVLTVNGEPLFVKGANLLPTRAALADASPDDVRRDIAETTDVAAANPELVAKLRAEAAAREKEVKDHRRPAGELPAGEK